MRRQQAAWEAGIRDDFGSQDLHLVHPWRHGWGGDTEGKFGPRCVCL